jgi:hypothetical protein
MVRLKKDKACNIRRLNLSNNDINDVGCISIAKIILGTILSHLDLSFNRISDWGASTILAAFETNEPSLRDINMEANPLSFAGGVDLCKILALPCSKITHLDLRGAKVTDVGIPYIAEALRSHHCPIVSLNLYDCQLTDTGIVKVAVKLSVNKSLRVLGLGCNSVGDRGIHALSQVLRLNTTLEELDLSQNDSPFSRSGLEAMMTTMRTNTSLLDLRLDVDGHTQELTRDSRQIGVTGGVGGDDQTDFQYLFQQPLLPSHHPLGVNPSLDEQLQSHQASSTNLLEEVLTSFIHPLAFNLTTPNLLAPTPVTVVGEVLAPTHAAVAQPLQVPALPPASALEPTTTMYFNSNLATVAGTAPPTFQTAAFDPTQGFFPQLLPNGDIGAAVPAPATAVAVGAGGGHPAVFTEQDAEREQLDLALSTLKTYVRHNFKRTHRLHLLCFEILAMSRVLLFAKDVVQVEPVTVVSVEVQGSRTGLGLSMEERDGGQDKELTLRISTTPSGLPTPPSSGSDKSSSPPLPCKVFCDATTTTLPLSSHKPRGTLAGLPWEVKEMILRKLDRQGLMSERQFQCVMNYAGSSWETTREPWERWGEIRELILEKTRCYYYES